MMRHQSLEHRFVRNAPRELESGVLYISMEYATAAHSCCCGCGERVVTPFTPTDWRMTFDGDSVSLHPSIGNWNQDCRSHYVIERGQVIEAGPWSLARIDAERRRDRRAKAAHYGGLKEVQSDGASAASDHTSMTAMQNTVQTSSGIWSRFKAWFAS